MKHKEEKKNQSVQKCSEVIEIAEFVAKVISNFITVFHMFKKVEQRGVIASVSRYMYATKNESNKTIFFCLFRATPAAYGGSQARGQIGGAAASLRPSHSKARSKPHLRPTPQLTATPDP